MLKRPGPALVLLGLLATLPASASAAAMTGLSTSVGLAGALVALLASQRGSPASAATVLGLSVLMLLLAVAFVQLRTPGIRFLPIFARRQLPRPLLARAVPSDDDRALLRQARRQFLDLQAAWDAADHNTLRRLTTEGMFAELTAQLPAAAVASDRTHVLALEAHLIARERLGPLELASIEFSGVVRDSARGSAMPLREVWMLTRSQPGEAWKLARQQALL